MDEIRNVIGDSLSEASLADIILVNDFDVAKSLDAALSNASDDTRKPSKIKKQGMLPILPQPLPSISDTMEKNIILSFSLEIPLPQRELHARPEKGEDYLQCMKLIFLCTCETLA